MIDETRDRLSYNTKDMAAEIIPSKKAVPPASGTENQQQGLSRRTFLTAAGVVGGAVVVGGGAIGLRRPFSSPASAEQRSPSLFSVETFPLPDGYKHDLIFPPNEIIAAADGGTSIALAPGKYLVLFGDTFGGELSFDKKRIESDLFPLANTAVIIDEHTQTMRVLTGQPDAEGHPTSWISPKENDGTFYWPQCPTMVNGDLIVPLMRTLRQPNGWKYAATDIKIFRDGNVDAEPEIISLPRPRPDEDFPTIWGTSIVSNVPDADGTKWTYIAGSTQLDPNTQPKGEFYGKEMRMARVRSGNLNQLDQWEFWNGAEWIQVKQTDDSRSHKALETAWKTAEEYAAPVIGKDKLLSNNYTLHHIDGKFVITSKEWDNLGNKINFFVADSLTGPFHLTSTIENLQQYIPDAYKPKEILPDKDGEKSVSNVTYAAYLHPEVPDPENRNRMLVTFSISPNSPNFVDEVKDNVDTYRRIAVWVDKEAILNGKA